MEKTNSAFTTRIRPRGYELDFNGHVAGAVLLQYGQQARWESLQAAGISYAQLRQAAIGPVSLEETIRYLREVNADDELDVGVRYQGEGSVVLVHQQFVRVIDDDVLVEIDAVTGVLDVASRKLLSDPLRRWRELATNPAIFDPVPE